MDWYLIGVLAALVFLHRTAAPSVKSWAVVACAVLWPVTTVFIMVLAMRMSLDSAFRARMRAWNEIRREEEGTDGR